MKIFSLATIAAVSLYGLSFYSVLAQAAFPKDSKVRLTKDAPLLFKTEQNRVGKAGETFTVIQHNTATKRIYMLATDASGNQIALNVAEDAVELAPATAAKPSGNPKPAEPKSEYTQMFEKLVPDGADTLQADRLEKGKRYRHYGYIFQVTNDMLLVDKMGARDEPWAMLVFADPKKMEGVSVESQRWVQAIVEFAGFKSVQMTSGAEKRLAVFKCMGFENSDTLHYVDCSAEGAEAPPPKAP